MRSPTVSTVLVPIFLLLFCVSHGQSHKNEDYQRSVTMELNPGLHESLEGVDLLHVRAVGQTDTLHYFFCSHKAPALILAYTNSSSSDVKVDWQAFINGSYLGSLRIVPETSVLFKSALVFTRLWEYDDANDTAKPEQLDPSSFFPTYELSDFSWDPLNSTVDQEKHQATLCGQNHSSSFSNGSLCLRFTAFGSKGRDSVWPGLQHNANSSQLRVWLDHVTPRSNQSRFLLELQAVTSGEMMNHVDVYKSIDDEYTPSIFKTSQWVSSSNQSSHPGAQGFVQWKPVAYTTAHPKIEDATPCSHSSPKTVNQLPPSGWVQAFFPDDTQASALNITFSIAGAPYYNVTSYLSWSMLVGLGVPPHDAFSPLVVTTLAVGLGAPLAFLLFGVGAVIFKRTPKQQTYEPIN